MTDSPKLSRRQWFRLRMPYPNKNHHEPSPENAQPVGRLANFAQAASNGLQPIEHPPNHDGLDLAKLPPMREAILSCEEVSDLFADIEQLASDVLLMQRPTGAQRANASSADDYQQLEAAKHALLNGVVPRLQIRYRWQNSHWIDTLRRENNGFHLVRINHQTM